MSDADGSQALRLAEDRKIESQKKNHPRIGPLDIRLRLYEEVLKLRRNSRSYEEIIKELSETYHVTLGKSTVSYWANGLHTPLGGINLFRPKPTPELAYVIGVIVGDGSLNVRANNYEYRIRLKAVDLDF